MNENLKHLIYKQNSISTLSPSEMTLRLNNLCLNYINDSKKAIELNNVVERNKNLKKAQSIISELMVMINMDQEASKKVFSIYEYLQHCLIEANIKNNLEKIEEVENYLVELQNVTKESIALKRKKIYRSDQV